MTNPQTAANRHAESFAVGDQVDYQGAALGSVRGVIADIRTLFDESGRRLKTFLVAIEGAVEQIHTSADALAKAGRKVPSASIEIPRSAYTDTTVEPAVDTRTGVDPADVPGAPFDEPTSQARSPRRKA